MRLQMPVALHLSPPMPCAARTWLRQSMLMACCLLSVAGAAPPVSTVKELKAAIYTDMPMNQGGDACVRLLHVNGTVGCAAPSGRKSVEGMLMRLDQLRPTAADYPGVHPGCPLWLAVVHATIAAGMHSTP